MVPKGAIRLATSLSAEGLLRSDRFGIDGYVVKYLVDANVLCEPTKPVLDSRLIACLRAHEQDIVVNPVILGELRFGILVVPKGRKRAALE